MASLFQNFHNIGGLLLANGLELFAIGNPQVRAHIIGTISQVDLQVLVTKYFLVVAKDGIRELWVERRNGLEARFQRRHEADIERLVGILEPCFAKVRKSGFAESKMDPYTLRGQEDQPWSKKKRRGARFQRSSEVDELRRRNMIVEIESLSNHPIKKGKEEKKGMRPCLSQRGWSAAIRTFGTKSRARLQASL